MKKRQGLSLDSLLTVNPFVSKAQQAKCWILKSQGKAGSWDCNEWQSKTQGALPQRVKGRKKGKKRRGVRHVSLHELQANLLRVDPSHTGRAANELTPHLDRRLDGVVRKVLTNLSSQDIDKEASKANVNPSKEQKHAGNFKKGHVVVQGLPVTIENPKGSIRGGSLMHHPYGYIKKLRGGQSTDDRDGDAIDVYLGPNPNSPTVYIIDQVNQKDTAQDEKRGGVEGRPGSFDEHKVMLGFGSREEAVAGYQKNYPPGWRVGSVTEMSIPQFKEWLKTGDLKRPAASQVTNSNPKGCNQHTGKECGGTEPQTTSPSTRPPSAREMLEHFANINVPEHLIPEHVYVGVPYEALDKIQSNGLEPHTKGRLAGVGGNRKDSVYVALHEARATGYAKSYPRSATIKVATKHLDKNKFYYDPLDVGEHDIINEPRQIAYRGTIPTHAIAGVKHHTEGNPEATTNRAFSRILEVPDIRQRDHYSCGCCATMAAAWYWGVGPDVELWEEHKDNWQDTEEQKKVWKAVGKWKKLLGTSVQESTHPDDIVRVLRGLGLQAIPKQGMTIDNLATYTNKGYPVIICCQDYGPWVPKAARYDYGHYLLVIGVIDGGTSRYVVCQDSSEDNVIAGGDSNISKTASLQKPGLVIISESDFDKAWHDRDADGKKFIHYGIAVGPTWRGKRVVNSTSPTSDNWVPVANAPGKQPGSGFSSDAERRAAFWRMGQQGRITGGGRGRTAGRMKSGPIAVRGAKTAGGTPARLRGGGPSRIKGGGVAKGGARSSEVQAQKQAKQQAAQQEVRSAVQEDALQLTGGFGAAKQQGPPPEAKLASYDLRQAHRKGVLPGVKEGKWVPVHPGPERPHSEEGGRPMVKRNQ